MKLSLIVAKGKRKGKVIPVTVPQFVIGRHRECHLRASSSAISQHHCAVLSRGAKVFVRDFDSTNGTFVNQKHIGGEKEVADGDLLEIGSLAFQIHIEVDAAESSLPAVSAGSEADDSTIAAMLLRDGENSPGILGLADDSRCGSTVLRRPNPASEQPQEPESDQSSPADKETASPAAAQNDQMAKELLEKFERSVREKYNPT
jgi:hypothetical protein